MEVIVYSLFIAAALFIAAEMNRQPAPVVTVEPVRTAAKHSAKPARLVIPVEAITTDITAAPIDWTKWGVRDRRWLARELGIKGAARLNNATAQDLIETAIS